MTLLTPFQAGIPLSATAQNPSLLIVTGEGQVEATPDTAEISLGVTTRAQQAAQAFQQTAATLTRVVQALQAAGIPQNQIQTSQVSLQPAFEDSRRVGFDATANVRVTLTDLNLVGPVIDRAVAAGANNVNGITFTLRDPGAAEAAALALAVQNGQRQAAALARSLGIALGPLFRVEAEPTQGPIVPVAVQAFAAARIPVLPGTITVTRRVQLQFLLSR